MLLGLSSCVEQDKIPHGNVVERFLQDPLAEDYFLAIEDVTAVGINRRKEFLETPSRLSEIKSLSEFKNYADEQYEKPEEVYSVILEFSSVAMRIKEKYPELVKLDEEKLKEVFDKYLVSQKEQNYGENFKVDPCSEQLDSSLDACREGAVIASFSCGLEAANVPSVIICLSAILGGLEICNDAAWDSFEICLKYN